MFTEAKFNETSVELIWKAAKSANVESLHIGMSGQPSYDLQEKLNLIELDEGYNHQWCEKGEYKINSDCSAYYERISNVVIVCN